MNLVTAQVVMLDGVDGPMGRARTASVLRTSWDGLRDQDRRAPGCVASRARRGLLFSVDSERKGHLRQRRFPITDSVLVSGSLTATPRLFFATGECLLRPLPMNGECGQSVLTHPSSGRLLEPVHMMAGRGGVGSRYLVRASSNSVMVTREQELVQGDGGWLYYNVVTQDRFGQNIENAVLPGETLGHRTRDPALGEPWRRPGARLGARRRHQRGHRVPGRGLVHPVVNEGPGLQSTTYTGADSPTYATINYWHGSLPIAEATMTQLAGFHTVEMALESVQPSFLALDESGVPIEPIGGSTGGRERRRVLGCPEPCPTSTTRSCLRS